MDKSSMEFWFLLQSLSSPPSPALGPPHISVGPFMLESFAETGDATIGRMHCDDSQ